MTIIPRKDVMECVKDAQTEAKKSKRTQYVGAIGFPDAGYSTLGFTDDKEMLEKLGDLWATVTTENVTMHA